MDDHMYNLLYELKGLTLFANNSQRLQNAIYKNNIKKVHSLLKKIDPNTLVDFGQSGLNIAVGLNLIDIVREFLNAGADPNKKDMQGKTPIWIASGSSS